MRLIRLVLALGVAAGVAASCGGKNPVTSNPDPVCDHFDADGWVLERAGDELAVQWQAQVTGGVTLDAGSSLDSLLVVWLTPDSARAAARSDCYSLRYEVADTTIAQAEAGAAGPWSIRLTGRIAGSTTLRLRIWHIDHADFTSQPLTVTVLAGTPHTPAGATGTLLFAGANLAASHGFHVAGVYGKLPVALGSGGIEFGVQFLDGNDQVLAALESGYSLGVAVGNPALARVDPVPGAPWRFRVIPITAGATTLSLSLRWLGGAEYTSGAFDLIVYDTLATPAVPVSFLLKKSGLRHVFVRDGAEVPQCCASVSTGFLPAQRDTIEDLFNFRLLAYNDCALPPSQRCAETTPSSSSAFIAFEFLDPALAGVVRHPEHPGEYHDFHLRGVASGETTVRLVYVTGTTVAFRSPPLRVVVGAGSPSVTWRPGSGE